MATTISKGRKSINIDPKDYDGMIKLMDLHEEFEMPLLGQTDKGERVLVSINSDNITTQTLQDNGWCRENIYWRNRSTEEKFYR